MATRGTSDDLLNDSVGTIKIEMNPVSKSWVSQPKLYHLCPNVSIEKYRIHMAAITKELLLPWKKTRPERVIPARANFCK